MMKINLNSIAKNSVEIFYRLRWSGQVCCPECGSVHVYNPEAGKLHICADCDCRFSDTSGTIFHCTKLGLDKWLQAIYLFLQTTRGISSYGMARIIGVSQTTAWSMLTKIRSALEIELNVPDGAILDEVFLGGDWKRKPAYEKLKKVAAPPAHWNLTDKERKDYYRSEIFRLSSEAKMPVLGIRSICDSQLSLLSFDIKHKKEFIQDQINELYGVPDKPIVIVTDQANCYNFLSADDNNFNHQICNHDKGKYKSQDGYSSNGLEGAFAHLKRMWRGTYQMWSNKYNQYYLNEFCWRYNHKSQSILDKFNLFFDYIDPRKLHFIDQIHTN